MNKLKRKAQLARLSNPPKKAQAPKMPEKQPEEIHQEKGKDDAE